MNKKIKLIQKATLIIVIVLLAISCNEPVTDFGLDGSFSGKVVDQSGNIVSGDITSAALTIQAMGENDVVTKVMRVKGDGTFANIRLFPQVYEVWIQGPVISDEKVTIDLEGGKSVVKDFVVTPFLSISTPTIIGNPTATSIDIGYQITQNGGYIASSRKEVYCSTIPYPTSNTGSGPSYDTKVVTLPDLQGTVSISELTSGTEYFIRIGARADGENAYNYSDQIIFTTP